MPRGSEYLRDLNAQREKTRETALGLEAHELPSWIETPILLRARKPAEIYHTSPELRFNEYDQTDPVGQFRFQGAGGGFFLQKSTTAAWGGTQTDYLLSFSVVNKLLTIYSGYSDGEVRLWGGKFTDLSLPGAVRALGTNYGSGPGVILATPNAAKTGLVTRISCNGNVDAGSGKITISDPIYDEGSEARITVSRSITLQTGRSAGTPQNLNLQTCDANLNAVDVARCVPTATATTPFFAITGNITTPLTGTLPSNWITLRYALGGAVTLFVNDNGTIRSLNLGTPA